MLRADDTVFTVVDATKDIAKKDDKGIDGGVSYTPLLISGGVGALLGSGAGYAINALGDNTGGKINLNSFLNLFVILLI